ncbi:MAG TPA: hypothetical protein DEP18_08005, partial [Flavobacteriales bacterium]|nr:hypothetical protein [Flavobacteriales bacterium]
GSISAQNICFRANNDFTSANGTNGVVNPRFLAKGDINGDGKLDIITSNGNQTGNPSSLSIFIGQGNGLFTYIDTITIGPNSSNTQAITLQDFNADGKLDIAVVKRNSLGGTFRLAVLQGNGVGDFTPWVEMTAPNFTNDLVTGDFDADGMIDIVTISGASSNNISFFKNNGAGFNAQVISNPTFLGAGYNIKVGQVDHLTDSHLDVVITRVSGSRVTLMRGNGTGSFTTGFNVVIGTDPRDLDLGDLNGDGNMDVAVAMNGSDSVHVVFTNGMGAITSISRYYSGGRGPTSIVMFDYDGDGDKDIAVSNVLDHVIGLLINDGSGNFTLQRHASFIDPSEILTGNFDSDLKEDIVFTGNSRRLMYMGNNSPNGFLSYNNLYYPTINTQPNSSSIADFNGDGNTDLVTANSSSNNFSLFLGNGSGGYTFSSNTSASAMNLAIQSGDFNGDGFKDVLLVESSAQQLSLFPGDGSGNFGFPTSVGLPGTPISLSVGDLDNDGDLDAVVTSNTSNAVYIYQNIAGVFSLAGTLSSGVNGPNNVSINNFNGDALPDLAICNNGTSNVQIYTGTGSCNFTSGSSIVVSAGPRMVTSGDFNGDGNKDISVCYGSSTISYANGTGTGTFSAAVNLTGITGAGQIVWLLSADLNADGFDDVVTCNNASSDVSALKGGGLGLSFQQAFYSGYKPVHIAQGLVNNDLLPDIAICNSDATGASSVNVMLNRSAVITNSGAGSFCIGGGVTLTSTQAYSYQWSTVATTQSINVTTSNSYTVTTSNYNSSCNSISQPEVVTVNPLPTVSGVTGTTTICGSSSTSLTANSSASSPVFEWYDAVSGGTLLFTGATFVTPVLGVNTSYWVQVTDGSSGCVSSPRFQVDVVIGDVLPPTINNCPSNITINVGAGQCSATASWTAPSATDNCGSATINQTIGLPSGSVFPVGTHNIQYTAVDGSSNSSSCSFTVTVVDNEAPVFTTCPSNISQNVAPASCNALVTWSAPTASDNCFATVTQTSGPASGSTLAVGNYSVVYTATDAASNTSTCTFTITIVDNLSPTITGCPSNQTLSNTPGTCGRVVTWTAPTATDNCAGATITQTAGPASGSTLPIGVTTITYTATDGASNTSTCSFTITVNDTQAPVIAGCPSNQTQSNTPGTCGRVVSWTVPTVTDNCSATITQTAGPSPGNTFPVGVTNVTYTATDAAGNVSTCSFTVTINDTQGPTITGTPSNITLSATTGTCSATATWTPPTATDNCTVPTIVQTSGPPSGSSFNAGTTPIVYTATDGAGNTSTVTFNVTVVDAAPPTFTNCPSNITICQGNPVTFPTPTATDGCDPSPTVTQIAGLPSGSVFPLGNTTVTFRATDASGNFTNCTFTVTVNSSPTVSFVLADDNACVGDPLMSLTTGTPFGGIYSGTGVSGSAFNPATAGVGAHTITYTVTNGNGCSAFATDVMTVFANPTVTFTMSPASICYNAAPVSVSGGSPAGGTYTGSGIAAGVLTPTIGIVGTHTATYTVTNSNNCSASATSTYTIGCVDIDEQDIRSTFMSVYPNPSNGNFMVEFAVPLNSPAMLNVFNAVGQWVTSIEVEGAQSAINISTLERGIYFITLDIEGMRYVNKVIIER